MGHRRDGCRHNPKTPAHHVCDRKKLQQRSHGLLMSDLTRYSNGVHCPLELWGELRKLWSTISSVANRFGASVAIHFNGRITIAHRFGGLEKQKKDLLFRTASVALTPEVI